MRLTHLAPLYLALAACGVSDAQLTEPAAELDSDELAITALGNKTDFDKGPPANSGWAELFAQTPDYRAVARAKSAEWLAIDPVTGKSKLQTTNEQLVAAGKPEIPLYTLTGEKFRYEMGPVFYRGRLDGTARVLVVGQDAATDEALVHRAFVGGTGQKVQNFLNSVGIIQSYLCLNTFIYSIHGQFDPYTTELATEGPIKEHRNQVIAKAFATSPIKLILSFGNAAHTSVQLYLDEKHGGQLPPGVVWVKMLHPGMAGVSYDPNVPGSGDAELQAVISSFTSGWWKVWSAKRANPSWLPSDSGGRTTQASKFNYWNASIPYRDLPFGAPWMLGRGGTMSERGSDLRVELRSPNGARYEAPYLPLPTSYKWNSGYVAGGPEDLPWEPPRADAGSRFDPGPSSAWVSQLVNTPYQSVLARDAGIIGADGGSGVENDFDHPVWYRGRTDGTANVLVIAQDTSTDSFVSGRALTGDDGQKINNLLARIGAGDRYLMLNVYPYLTANVDAAKLQQLQQTPALVTHRNKLISRGLTGVKLVLTFGEPARLAFQAAAGTTFTGTWLHLPHPKEAGAPSGWNMGMLQLLPQQAALGLSGGDFAPYSTSSFAANVRTAVPRADLPYGAPMWMGTSGDLSQQASASWLFWNAPRWVDYE